MKVNDRKLFANRDARRQLSQMGGIVASSPELLGVAQKFNMGGEARFMSPNDRLNLLMNSPYVIDQAEMLGMTPQDFIGGLSPARGSRIVDIEMDLANRPDTTPTPEPTPAPVLQPTPDPASMERQTEQEDAANRVLDVAATFEEQGTQDEMRRLATAVEESDDPNAAASEQIIATAGMDPASTTEERIRQYEEIFTRMFGQDDEAKRRERYMNLAMIGFAIAAGEDPSALKNIADGMLRGTEVASENARRQEARMDAARTAAVQAGMADVRDERAAARAASAADLQYQRQIDMFNLETDRRTAEADVEFERDLLLAAAEASAGPGEENVPNPAELFVNTYNSERTRISGLVEAGAQGYYDLSEEDIDRMARRGATQITKEFMRNLQNPSQIGTPITPTVNLTDEERALLELD